MFVVVEVAPKHHKIGKLDGCSCPKKLFVAVATNQWFLPLPAKCKQIVPQMAVENSSNRSSNDPQVVL